MQMRLRKLTTIQKYCSKYRFFNTIKPNYYNNNNNIIFTSFICFNGHAFLFFDAYGSVVIFFSRSYCYRFQKKHSIFFFSLKCLSLFLINFVCHLETPFWIFKKMKKMHICSFNYLQLNRSDCAKKCTVNAFLNV